MIFFKFLLFLLLFMASTYAGVLFSKKYVNRVEELKEIKSFLNILKNKIKFTYEPLGEIFKEISDNFSINICNLLKEASNNMKLNSAGKSWNLALEKTKMNIKNEDKQVLTSLSKMLGKTDIEGQVSQINQTAEFLDIQIENAKEEKEKNEKLYKTLGMVVGAGLVIILI